MLHPVGDPGRRLHITWFLGPNKVYNLSGISIGSTVFVTLTVVTNRQTDRHLDRQTDRQTDHATIVSRGHV